MLCGVCETVLVFLFFDPREGFVFWYVWLFQNHRDIEVFAFDIIRLQLSHAIYGIRCQVDFETGRASISRKERNKVTALHERICTTSKNVGTCRPSAWFHPMRHQWRCRYE